MLGLFLISAGGGDDKGSPKTFPLIQRSQSTRNVDRNSESPKSKNAQAVKRSQSVRNVISSNLGAGARNGGIAEHEFPERLADRYEQAVAEVLATGISQSDEDLLPPSQESPKEGGERVAIQQQVAMRAIRNSISLDHISPKAAIPGSPLNCASGSGEEVTARSPSLLTQFKGKRVRAMQREFSFMVIDPRAPRSETPVSPRSETPEFDLAARPLSP